jgi:hypothetical protein
MCLAFKFYISYWCFVNSYKLYCGHFVNMLVSRRSETDIYFVSLCHSCGLSFV